MTLWTAACQVPCLSLSPRVSSNSCPLSRWYHQTSHSLSTTSPPALNLSQHLGLCQWVGSLKHMAKVLESQLQHQFFQWIFRAYFLWDWQVWSTCCSRDSRVFSSNTVESINSSVHSLFYSPITHPYTTTRKTIDYRDLCSQMMSLLFIFFIFF